MSDESKNEEPFDLDRLKNLIELMEKHDLTKVDLRRGNERWQLQRGGTPEAVQVVPAALPPQPVAAAPVSAPAPTAAAAPAEIAPVDDGTIEITSPTVGTFYTAPSPEEADFVSVGSKVKPDTIVCIVEAMKVFNQIPADVSGEIVKALVKNGDAVEYGQPLYKVNPV